MAAPTIPAFSWEVIGFKRKVEDLISDDGTMAINSDDELEVSGYEAMVGVAFNDSWRMATYPGRQRL